MRNLLGWWCLKELELRLEQPHLSFTAVDLGDDCLALGHRCGVCLEGTEQHLFELRFSHEFPLYTRRK